MKFRPITVRLESGEILKWEPQDIDRIIINNDYIKINGEVIRKSECYWPNWDYFINELNRWYIL